MRPDTWILIGLFLWIGLCILANAIIQRGRRIERLRRALADERAAHLQTISELQTALKRDDAKRSHECMIRDTEIDRLNQEIGMWQQKYKTLEAAMNRMWPKGDVK